MIHVFKEYEHCCSNLTQTQLHTVQCKPIVFETQNIVLSCTILSSIVSAVDLCFNLVVISCKKKNNFNWLLQSIFTSVQVAFFVTSYMFCCLNFVIEWAEISCVICILWFSVKFVVLSKKIIVQIKPCFDQTTLKKMVLSETLFVRCYVNYLNNNNFSC